MNPDLKLFVWEDVLTDYTSGVMFALAHDVEEARQLILAKCDYVPQGDICSGPIVITEPEGFVVWGGG